MTAQTYAVITPVRDEAENLARLADCMQAQTIQPDAWVIVDNGSVDDTLELANRLAAAHDWIRTITAEPADVARPGAPIVRAFNVGLAQLDALSDVVVKLDADVSMGDDYFERILAAFTADPRLGIAGGACFELRDGVWEETFVTGDAVRGASRCYRRECLEAVSPLEERVGWDGIDELKANLLGGRPRLLRDVPFRHHRRVGERDGSSTARWRRAGRGRLLHGLPLQLPHASHAPSRGPPARGSGDDPRLRRGRRAPRAAVRRRRRPGLPPRPAAPHASPLAAPRGVRPALR